MGLYRGQAQRNHQTRQRVQNCGAGRADREKPDRITRQTAGCEEGRRPLHQGRSRANHRVPVQNVAQVLADLCALLRVCVLHRVAPGRSHGLAVGRHRLGGEDGKHPSHYRRRPAGGPHQNEAPPSDSVERACDSRPGQGPSPGRSSADGFKISHPDQPICVSTGKRRDVDQRAKCYNQTLQARAHSAEHP
ncbi:hypothetical protein D3C77_334060 [compost metagenome]